MQGAIMEDEFLHDGWVLIPNDAEILYGDIIYPTDRDESGIVVGFLGRGHNNVMLRLKPSVSGNPRMATVYRTKFKQVWRNPDRS